MLPPLNMELSLEQSFSLAAMEQSVSQLPREEVEKMLLSALRQKALLQNAFNNLVKHCG